MKHFKSIIPNLANSIMNSALKWLIHDAISFNILKNTQLQLITLNFDDPALAVENFHNYQTVVTELYDFSVTIRSASKIRFK